MATHSMDEYGSGDSLRSVREEEDVHALWESRSRIVLSPVAAPSILGLFGFATATFMVASNLAGWWASSKSLVYIVPTAIFFGGAAQLLAGMWAYKARDGLATAMPGMWGSFWIAWGMLELLMATGTIPMPATAATYLPAFAFWFVMLGLLTGIGTFAAIPRGAGMAGTLGCLAAGSDLLAIAFFRGNVGIRDAAGWVLVASVCLAVYTASALLSAESSGGKTVLPLGKAGRAANIPGRRIMWPIQYPQGDPGVTVGQ